MKIDAGFNPRSDKNMIPDEELVASVKERGVINPIHVRTLPGDKLYHVVDGHRRVLAVHASVTLGKDKRTIPILNHGQISDKESLVIALTTNDNRKSFTKRETIDAVERLSGFKMTPAAIGKVLGKSMSTIQEYLAVNKASPRLRAAAKKDVKKGGVSPRAAAQASSLPKKEQDKLVKELKGKPTKEAVATVKEKKASKTHRPTVKTDPKEATGTKRDIRVRTPGEPRRKEYRLVSDYKERCEMLDHEVQKRLNRNPSNKELIGMQKVVAVLKGKMTVEQAFVRWDEL